MVSFEKNAAVTRIAVWCDVKDEKGTNMSFEEIFTFQIHSLTRLWVWITMTDSSSTVESSFSEDDGASNEEEDDSSSHSSGEESGKEEEEIASKRWAFFIIAF